MYTASELAVALALSVRRTNVQALGATGGVIVAVFGRTAIDATITSPAAVPAGFAIVSDPDVTAAEDAARNVIVAAPAGVPGVINTPTSKATAANPANSHTAPARSTKARVRRINDNSSQNWDRCDSAEARHRHAQVRAGVLRVRLPRSGPSPRPDRRAH
jgi:hypothetical protein